MTETENLLLRNWQKSDAAALYQMCRDETLRRSGAAFFESIHDAEEAIRFWEKDSRFKAIIHRESGESIGFISLGDMNRYEGYMELVIVVIGDGSVCHTFVTLLFSFCEFAVCLRKTQLWSVASGGLLSRRADLQCKCNKNKKAVTQRGITLKMVVARQPKKEGDLNEPLPSS